MQGAVPHGHGKFWLSKGRIFHGYFSGALMIEGDLYELQEDNTYSVYKVKYDPNDH